MRNAVSNVGMRIAASLLVLLSSFIAIADVSAPHAAADGDHFGAPRVALTSVVEGYAYLVFALYERGRVAYRVPDDPRHEKLMTVTLSTEEEAALLANLSFDRVGRMHPPERAGADGATQCIHVWHNGKHNKDCIWEIEEGSWAPGLETPADMARIWMRLAHFSSSRAHRWVPSSLVAAVRAAGGRPCPAHIQERWPMTWPRPDDSALARIAHGAPWTFVLPLAERPTLDRLASWSTPTPMGGCDQGVFMRGLLVDVSYEASTPP